MSLPTEQLITELQSYGVRLADPKAGVESRRAVVVRAVDRHVARGQPRGELEDEGLDPALPGRKVIGDDEELAPLAHPSRARR